MPHFEDFYADKLRGALGVEDADAVLDLRDASREAAAAAIQNMLERSRFADAKSVAIRLSPPPAGGGRNAVPARRKGASGGTQARLDRSTADLAGSGRIGILRRAFRKAREPLIRLDGLEGARRRKRLERSPRQQKRTPKNDEAEGRGEQPFLRDRNRRFEIGVGGDHDVHVAVANHQCNAPKRARIDHPLPVRLEPRKAVAITLHRGALTAREVVGVGAQASDGGLRGFAVRARILVEPAYHLSELVDAAAEALAILLRKFRPL